PPTSAIYSLSLHDALPISYLSFDIDALDPSIAPGTGTPEAGGLTMREAQGLVRGLRGLDLIGADVVEVSPPFDPGTNTALCGARSEEHTSELQSRENLVCR